MHMELVQWDAMERDERKWLASRFSLCFQKKNSTNYLLVYCVLTLLWEDYCISARILFCWTKKKPQQRCVYVRKIESYLSKKNQMINKKM